MALVVVASMTGLKGVPAAAPLPALRKCAQSESDDDERRTDAAHCHDTVRAATR